MRSAASSPVPKSTVASSAASKRAAQVGELGRQSSATARATAALSAGLPVKSSARTRCCAAVARRIGSSRRS